MNPTLKILFVDDTRGKTSTLADILALSGDEPVLAFYGNESLNKARQMPIDCVFQRHPHAQHGRRIIAARAWQAVARAAGEPDDGLRCT
jgi:hypothetical protein